MNKIISFGMYEGNTFEWLFFHAPWYANWMYMNNVHEQRHNFTEEEEKHFLELFRRSSQLTGTCKHCNEQPITQMGLSTRQKDGAFARIGLYCDECSAPEHLTTWYIPPSFFVDEWPTMPRNMHLNITKAIGHRYIGNVVLTQMRMEQFFGTDEYFVDATPGFFARECELA